MLALLVRYHGRAVVLGEQLVFVIRKVFVGVRIGTEPNETLAFVELMKVQKMFGLWGGVAGSVSSGEHGGGGLRVNLLTTLNLRVATLAAGIPSIPLT